MSGTKRWPSLTPGFLFRKEPVATRRATHSMGTMWQRLATNDVASRRLT